MFSGSKTFYTVMLEKSSQPESMAEALNNASIPATARYINTVDDGSYVTLIFSDDLWSTNQGLQQLGQQLEGVFGALEGLSLEDINNDTEEPISDS